MKRRSTGGTNSRYRLHETSFTSAAAAAKAPSEGWSGTQSSPNRRSNETSGQAVTRQHTPAWDQAMSTSGSGFGRLREVFMRHMLAGPVRHSLSHGLKMFTAAPMNSRVQLSRPPLERMLRIHDELRRGTLTNCTKLVRILGVCRKTVLRDLAFMRDRLDLPIEFDPLIQAYRYTHPVTSFPTVHVTEGELLALLVAQRALEQYRGTPFHRSLEIAFEKLSAGLRDRISFSPADELRAVSFKNVGLGRTDLAAFNALSGAVLRQHEVEFDYRKPGDSAKTHRRVRPYHLAHRENLWYLIAFDIERAALRTFALPRISGVAVTKTHFAKPTDFTPESFFADALGVLGGGGNHRVVIRFSTEAADRVREREWHESQELRELPGSCVELRLRLGALAEIERWVLGWGASAEVVEPRELRERVREAAAKTVAVYE